MKYTVADLVYYTGFIGGIVAVVLATQPLGWPRIGQLAAGLVAGLALGTGAQILYSKATQDPQGPGGPDDRRP